MLIDEKIMHWVCATSLLGTCLIAVSGCQTWHSSSAIPGMGSKQGVQQVLREAKNDPFPSPSDVGMKGTR